MYLPQSAHYVVTDLLKFGIHNLLPQKRDICPIYPSALSHSINHSLGLTRSTPVSASNPTPSIHNKLNSGFKSSSSPIPLDGKFGDFSYTRNQQKPDLGSRWDRVGIVSRREMVVDARGEDIGRLGEGEVGSGEGGGGAVLKGWEGDA